MRVKDLKKELREGKKGEMALQIQHCPGMGAIEELEINDEVLNFFTNPVIIKWEFDTLRRYYDIQIAEKC